MTRRLDLLSPSVPSWELATEAPSRPGTAVTLVPGFEAGTIEPAVTPGELVVGTGDGTATDLERAGAAVGRRTREDSRVSHLAQAHGPEADLTAYVEAVTLGRWVSPRWSADGATTSLAPGAHVLVTGSATSVSTARVRARASLLARSLATTPANIKSPAWMARQASTLAKRTGLTAAVWSERALAADGFGGLLAVGGGSATPPRLVQVDWRPPGAPRRGAQPVVIVGKGITFDTGGLDLKPSSAMLLMKKDMGGAAVALAVARMLMEARADVCLRVLIPAVENSVAGNAYRPGDVLRSRKGLSVEITNTDAEGRLVLADALTEADAARPALLLDFATLTGAARTALGPELPALYSNDPALLAQAQACGTAECDPVWPLPLWDGYDDDLGSRVADLANASSTPFAGSIVAALFLRRFVAPTTPWVHFDLFAWNPRERPGRPIGAEAQCARLAYRLVRERCG